MDNETRDILQQILQGQQRTEVRFDKLEGLVTGTAVIQENTISNKLQPIRENQICIMENNKKHESQAARIEALEIDVLILKYALKSFKPNEQTKKCGTE